ncbi:MAG: heavy-metal-associated domain-containing protein [Solirubrobacterales bacterium]|nr:heavy-metal-associated domain-containing protein [Solirubrobacterales bacterium]
MSIESDQIREYRVEGMSCSNCEAHVRKAVEALGGVSSAEADAGANLLRVSGSGLDDSVIAAAVDDAGYEAIPR